MAESLWLDCAPLDELQPPHWLLTPAERRRLKAILVLVAVWGTVTLLHWIPMTQWLVLGLALGLAIQGGLMLKGDPEPLPTPLPSVAALPSSTARGLTSDLTLPIVTILIPAKNESTVLPRLLESLKRLDYPETHLDLWVIDDGSTDATPEILQHYQAQIPHLNVFQRPEGSRGGKSGALNQTLPQTRGEVILVCDADALVPPDFLRSTLPLFAAPGSRPVGAVQVRKAILNADQNFWTTGQQAEMALDLFLQQQRTSIGGVGELRGNGQLVRRELLEKCGGWNEATITDDLDLTFKLHLAGVDIAFTPEIAIQEEGVTRWISLWHQRSRWAEGGYQRYLDYWPGILRNGMGLAKSRDLLLFFVNQYLLPMAVVPDLFWTLTYSHRPALLPLNAILLFLTLASLWGGMRQIQGLRGWALVQRTLLGLIYMLHWLPVMIATTTRMCIQPKRLKWVKTVHQGTGQAS